MDRLTIPDEKIDGGWRRTVIDIREVKENAMTLYWQLKKYEDTGLSPKQITELKEENERLKDISHWKGLYEEENKKLKADMRRIAKPLEISKVDSMAHTLAIDALKYQEKYRWHKVADGNLPVHSNRVLVYIKYKASEKVPPYYVANYAGGKWWYPSDREITGEARVIAWMELPVHMED